MTCNCPPFLIMNAFLSKIKLHLFWYTAAKLFSYEYCCSWITLLLRQFATVPKLQIFWEPFSHLLSYIWAFQRLITNFSFIQTQYCRISCFNEILELSISYSCAESIYIPAIDAIVDVLVTHVYLDYWRLFLCYVFRLFLYLCLGLFLYHGLRLFWCYGLRLFLYYSLRLFFCYCFRFFALFLLFRRLFSWLRVIDLYLLIWSRSNLHKG